MVQLLTLCWIKCVEITWQIYCNALTSYWSWNVMNMLGRWTCSDCHWHPVHHAMRVVVRQPSRKLCSITHSLLVMEWDVMRLLDRDRWSATYCLLAMECDWLEQKMHHHSQSVGHVKIWRETAVQCHIHPVGHGTTLDCLPGSMQFHSHPVGNEIIWHATPWPK